MNKITFLVAIATVILASCKKEPDVTVVNTTNIYIRGNQPRPLDTTITPIVGAWTGTTHAPVGCDALFGQSQYYLVLADKTFNPVWMKAGQPYIDAAGNRYFKPEPAQVTTTNEMNQAIDARFASGATTVLVWINTDGGPNNQTWGIEN